MVKNWLITGGCGFIGTSLIKALLHSDPKVNIRVIDNLSIGNEGDLGEVCQFEKVSCNRCDTELNGVQLVVGDIRDPELTRASAGGIDCIVHLAANTGVGPSVHDPRLDMETNVIGVFNLLESARANNVGKFIFASSGAPIGDICELPIHEELPARPVSPYGASKLAGEGYCSSYFRTYGVNTVALRFGNVYGPRSKHKASVIAKFIKLALEGKFCEIYGNGNQTRDFIYIDDLVSAIEKASKADVGGEIFQIATNEEHTLMEVVEILSAALSQFDIRLYTSHVGVRAGDVHRNYSNIAKARDYLGWVPSVSLEEGIKRTTQYFLSID